MFNNSIKKTRKGLLVLGVCLILAGCRDGNSASNDFVVNDTTLIAIEENIQPDFEITEGVVCDKEQTFRVCRNGRNVAIIKVGSPIIVSQAVKTEDWGYFQFPKIYRNYEGNIIVQWQMRRDTHEDYGTSYSLEDRMMSRDEGMTWEKLDKDYIKQEFYVSLINGNVLCIETPASKNIKDYDNFPRPLNKSVINSTNFYPQDELPEDLKGIYMSEWVAKEKKQIKFKANLWDAGYLRYAINDLMPVVWWGDIKEMSDRSLISGVYPTYS